MTTDESKVTTVIELYDLDLIKIENTISRRIDILNILTEKLKMDYGSAIEWLNWFQVLD